MRILHASIVVVSLLLTAALAGALAQPIVASAQPVSTQPVEPTGDRASYLERIGTDMHDWRLKLDRFSETARAGGQKAVLASQRDLDAAWADTEVEARKLRAAGADGWAAARSAYERSYQALTDTWQKRQAGDQ